MKEIKFRAFNTKTKVMVESATLQEICKFAIISGREVGKDVVFQQFTGLKDKKGKEIYEGDILKVYVNRENYDYHDNIYHGGYYLNCEVLDIRGNLKYNKKAIEKLEEPIGKERQSQLVNYDTNLFQTYNINRMIKDEKGQYVIDEKDPNKNIKRYLDIEVIGNIYENPKLLKVNK